MIEQLRRILPVPASPAQAMFAVVGALAVIAALAIHSPSGDPALAGPVRAAPPPPDPSPAAVTSGGLRRLSRTLGRPIYWVGPRAGTTYELRRAAGGNIFVRYVPAGAAAGSKGAYLTVGTYPVTDAFRATQSFATQANVGSKPVAGGGLAVYRLAQATNVYVVFPGLDYQLEVFSADAAEALRLATNGDLRPVA